MICDSSSKSEESLAIPEAMARVIYRTVWSALFESFTVGKWRVMMVRPDWLDPRD